MKKSVQTNQPTMMTYIKETPRQLDKNVKNSTQLTKKLVDLYVDGHYEDIVIIASGSSNNGSQAAKPFMVKYLDCNVTIITPTAFDFGQYKLRDTDFPMVISQSGCSTNSIDALKHLKKNKRLPIGITGNLNSDFQDVAEPNIDYGVGVETVGYVTKGVTTLVEFLILFSLEAAKRLRYISTIKYQELIKEITKCAQYNAEIREATLEFFDKHQPELLSMTTVATCGFIQGYGIGCEAALKIGETVKIPSYVYEAEEFIHGPSLQLTPNYTVFLVDDFAAGSKRIVDIYKAVRSVGARVFVITNNKAVDEPNAFRLPHLTQEPLLSPLYVLPFFQVIAYKATEALNRWEKHPLYAKFENIAKTKTAAIKRVMPRL
jgi:glucoselysine-6-phosphate deglycase